MFDLIMLWWVLPSLVVFLLIVTVFRFDGLLPEDTSDQDMKYTTLSSIFWPAGAVAAVVFIVAIIYDYLSQLDTSALFKERKL